jgi:hypothetical protein
MTPSASKRNSGSAERHPSEVNPAHRGSTRAQAASSSATDGRGSARGRYTPRDTRCQRGDRVDPRNGLWLSRQGGGRGNHVRTMWSRRPTRAGPAKSVDKAQGRRSAVENRPSLCCRTGPAGRRVLASGSSKLKPTATAQHSSARRGPPVPTQSSLHVRAQCDLGVTARLGVVIHHQRVVDLAGCDCGNSDSQLQLAPGSQLGRQCGRGRHAEVVP